MDFNIKLNQFMELDPLFTSGMSIFQMEHFVINDHITPYRKIKQAVIEARARIESATVLSFDIEELEIKIKQAENKKSTTPDNNEILLAKVEIRRHKFELDRKQRILNQTKDEIEFFVNTISKLIKDNFKSEEEAIKLLNNKEYIDNAEQVFWKEKLSRSVFSDLINYNTISKGLFESILCLPDNMMSDVIQNGIAKHLVHTKESSKLIDKNLSILDK